MKQRVTITRTEVVEVSDVDAQRIVDAAKSSGLTAQRLRIDVAALLPEPERRVVICADEDWSTPLDADFESEEDRRACEYSIECNGVWGYVCEQRDTVDGKWEFVDSCWGFIGTQDMLSLMRDHMPAAFDKLDTVDENDTERYRR